MISINKQEIDLGSAKKPLHLFERINLVGVGPHQVQSLLPTRKPAVNGGPQAGVAAASLITPQVNADYRCIGSGDTRPEVQSPPLAGANLKDSFRV